MSNHLIKEVLAFIESSGTVFYLGGGTALSRFHYNHRYSDDLDFFTFEEIDFIEVVQGLHQKRTTDPLLVSETLGAFPAADLDKVRWITPIQVEHFEKDRDIMVQNIITKEGNQLFEKS